MKTDTKVLICYNSPVSIFSVYTGKPAVNEEEINDLSESSLLMEIERIAFSLRERYSSVEILPIDRNIELTIRKINELNPDIIFNFVESVEGIASYEYCMAGLFELLGYKYTGNPPITLGNCLNKERTKSILRSFGINTPSSHIFKYNGKIELKDFKLNFPVIVKLLNEDASIGISENSVLNNSKSLKKQLKFLFDTYKQDVLAEEYIEGREINAAVLGGQLLPLSEIRFESLPEGLPKIVTYEGKWVEGSVYYENTKPQCPADLQSDIQKEIEKTALCAYEAMGCRDYARVDIRLNKDGKPFVIEVNPNPDITTDSGFARAAAAKGLSYTELLVSIAEFAMIRKRNDSQNKAS